MKRIFIYSLLTLLIGCKPSTEQMSMFKVNAKLNKVSRVMNELSLKVKRILDSRCPEGCDCIWAGEARVFLSLSDKWNSVDTCLILPSRPKIKFNNYSIEIIDVDPYPICNYQFPNDETVQFKICKINREGI